MTPRPPTHYDVLGVAPTATAAEVRQAYLRLARRHHPDAHAGTSAELRRRHASRMQAVTAAWAVLGDSARRRAYDARLASTAPPTPDPPPAQHLDDGDMGADERWRADLDEAFRRGPRPSRVLVLAPAVVFVLAVLMAVAGFLFTSRGLLAAGVIAGAVSGALFLLAPLAVMTRARDDGS